MRYLVALLLRIATIPFAFVAELVEFIAAAIVSTLFNASDKVLDSRPPTLPTWAILAFPAVIVAYLYLFAPASHQATLTDWSNDHIQLVGAACAVLPITLCAAFAFVFAAKPENQ